MENHPGVPRLPAATLYTSANNVKGAVPSPNVNLLGIVDTFAACEQLCFSAAASLPCFSFTWHSPAFTKPQYQRHCYGRRDTVWAPVAESMIDSGCRTDIGVASRCAVGPPPGPRLLLREGGPLPLPSPFAWALAAKESPARLLPRPRRLPER